jgi:hypothetical protein
MADPEQRESPTDAPNECMPCHGSGQLMSQLGGETSSVECPWCEGRGLRLSGIDAQARWLKEREENPPAQSADTDSPAAES